MSSSGCGKSRTPRKDAGITLLSYQNNNKGKGNYQARYNNNNSNRNTNSIPPIVAKKSEKFFRTLRKRSKSATRLHKSSADFRGSDCSLNDYQLDEPICQNYNNNYNNTTNFSGGGNTLRGPRAYAEFEKKEKVTLVGFSSQCELNLLDDNPAKLSKFEFGGSVYNLSEGSHMSKRPNNNFATLKTSREVKMERERLRQERMSRVGSPLFAKQADKPSQNVQNGGEAMSNLETLKFPNETETRLKFFEEAKQKFHERRNFNNFSPNENEFFSQFFRENQERFAQLVKQQRMRMATAASSSDTSTSSRGSSCQSSLITKEDSPGAFSSSSNFNKKANNSQSEKEGEQSNSEVANLVKKTRHIQIKRENLNLDLDQNGEVILRKESDQQIDIVENKPVRIIPIEKISTGSDDSCHSSLSASPRPNEQDAKLVNQNNKKLIDVQRTLSSLSSSSGVSSIEDKNGSSDLAVTNSDKSDQVVTSCIDQEKKSFHHPTFTNHFGFFARSKNSINESNSCSKLPTLARQQRLFERTMSQQGVNCPDKLYEQQRTNEKMKRNKNNHKLSVTKSKSVSVEENGRTYR